MWESSLAPIPTRITTASGKMSKPINLGICAMDKKALSKPMREILSRLPSRFFNITIFGDECILHQPVYTWPIVECLIAFSSSKFPTQKALEYIALRKPFLVNDLSMDAVLNDRRKVYQLLMDQGIDVPSHIVLSREDPSFINIVEEFDEYIIINGKQINKPFVEKPIDAEDHNIYIYYPMSAGGGSKRLFRKVNDRSSEFYPLVNEIRCEGSYIYEEFVITQGTDVKVYTVGPEYGHAEARKSPVVDGKVNRDIAGMEVRFPVILSQNEKDIIRKIVNAFRQTVCGFDILRVRGKSYVCDVNGWSFVKNSRKYYDDASSVLAEYILNALRPKRRRSAIPSPDIVKITARDSRSTTPSPRPDDVANAPMQRRDSKESVASMTSEFLEQRSRGESGVHEELLCVVAVIRHGDRTPKQKLKVMVQEERLLKYFHKFTKSPRKDLKVKSKTALVEFLGTIHEVINEGRNNQVTPEVFRKVCQIRDVLERWEISGINRKLQMKPVHWDDAKSDNGEVTSKATEIEMILKWGGDLTPLGREQAEKQGTHFRHCMYPDSKGGGVLRLHSTYRHDLKIKASDEGRVMKTAAAFTKGLLELEGPLTPILVSLVTIEEKNRQMLDKGGNCEIKEDMDKCKAHLEEVLQRDVEVDDALVNELFPDCVSSVRAALIRIGNPRQALTKIHELIDELCKELNSFCIEYSYSLENGASDNQTTDIKDHMGLLKQMHLSETPSLMNDRWEKLNKDFKNKKTGLYDLTKVPDVYDMARYDVLHNSHLGLTGLTDLLEVSRDLADVVVPQEYGITKEDKVAIGSKMCGALLEKIKRDLWITQTKAENDLHFSLDHSHAEELDINSPTRQVRTRLYFTSESHLHTLLNVLRFPPDQTSAISPEGLKILESSPELSYLTQIVIRLFEVEPNTADASFRCEIKFSPGAINDPISDKSSDTSPFVTLNSSISFEQMFRILDCGIARSHSPNEQRTLAGAEGDQCLSEGRVVIS